MAGTTHGKDACIFLNGYDLSGDFMGCEITMTRENADDTAFKDVFRSKVSGLGDGSVSLDGFYNAAAGGSDAVIQPVVGTGSDIFTCAHEGDTEGNIVYMAQLDIAAYSVAATVDDVVKATMEGVAKTRGIERGVSLHALGAETSTGNGTIVDNGASSASGGSAFLHVTAGAGFGTVDFDVRHSNDNFSADDNSLAAFTQVSAANASERITFSGTVERYLRIAFTLTTTSSVTFHVGVVRH